MKVCVLIKTFFKAVWAQGTSNETKTLLANDTKIILARSVRPTAILLWCQRAETTTFGALKTGLKSLATVVWKHW